MLDEEEWVRVMGFRGAGGGEDLWGREFGAVLDEYERITGFRETNINAIYHHRASMYGPPCGNCGKPLRTPVAKFCGPCGARRGDRV